MKKIVLAVIITAVICISGTVFAVTRINANQVTYTKNGTNTTVENALNDVYTNLDTKMMINTFGTPDYQTSQGTPTVRRSINPKSVPKGKYIVVYSNGESWNDVGDYATSSGVSNLKQISCGSSNCTINYLGGYHNQPKAVTPITANYKTMMSVCVVLYYVEIKEDTDTISAYTTAAATYDTGAQFVTIQVIPIN